ncbi:MAG TPA: hypothetical protein VFE62_05435 [Gemmataceae bacterium]|nr:hypothetical protein [Gemmataceae bacterium]
MITTPSPAYFSTGTLAELLCVQSWRIARLFETGAIKEPPRISGRRMIPKEMVPEVITALRDRGWLPSTFNSIEL